MLQSGHVVVINNVECVTLGHSFSGPVVAHPYFGSPAVISDLSKMAGWANGLVEFDAGCMIRDEVAGGLLCGFDHSRVLVRV